MVLWSFKLKTIKYGTFEKGVLFIMIKVMINNTPFSKSAIFNCFQFKTSEHHLDYDCIFTVFVNFHWNRFCFIWEPRELAWGSVWSILHSFFRSIFYIFFKNSKNWNHISRFFRFQTQETRFFGLGTFLHVFFMSKNSSIYLQFGRLSINSLRCSTKVFPMNLPVNMALALF